MDRRRQHCVQLARPKSDSSSANNTKPTRQQPNDDDAAHLLISMCPSLYLAVYSGRTEEVMEELLLHQKGAARDHGKAAAGIRHEQCDILEVSAERNTVPHVAAEKGHDELIQELYHRFREHGLLLSHRNTALDTPLHCTARAGHVRAVPGLRREHPRMQKRGRRHGPAPVRKARIRHGGGGPGVGGGRTGG
ncbi:unnamed protein product [Miscanthus lutarioriparius]|uniref:Uncharacterized protein n=1 Tax=Miscanthus lutarioriparius TaxID=422564 RepID=A0A811QCR2_9POAL|nr:unnamed protein product [Miscanthus lutarioriparius]